MHGGTCRSDRDSLAARDAMLCRCGIPCSFSDNAEAECEACLQRALQVDSTHFDAHLQVCTLVVTLERSARADQCASHWRCDRAVGAGVVHRSCIHRSDHGHRPSASAQLEPWSWDSWRTECLLDHATRNNIKTCFVQHKTPDVRTCVIWRATTRTCCMRTCMKRAPQFTRDVTRHAATLSATLQHATCTCR